jgi:hypothetical protein
MTDDILNTQLKTLQALLPEAEKKKRLAEGILNSPAYTDYQEWVKRYTESNFPPIQDFQSLFQYVSQYYINKGVKIAASYFEMVHSDADIIAAQIQDYQSEFEGA